MPQSRPMPTIGVACHELRIADERTDWRIVYHVAPEAIVILDVFAKKTATTPKHVLTDCKARLTEYRRLTAHKKGGHDAHGHTPKA